MVESAKVKRPAGSVFYDRRVLFWVDQRHAAMSRRPKAKRTMSSGWRFGAACHSAPRSAPSTRSGKRTPTIGTPTCQRRQAKPAHLNQPFIFPRECDRVPKSQSAHVHLSCAFTRRRARPPWGRFDTIVLALSGRNGEVNASLWVRDRNRVSCCAGRFERGASRGCTDRRARRDAHRVERLKHHREGPGLRLLGQNVLLV